MCNRVRLRRHENFEILANSTRFFSAIQLLKTTSQMSKIQSAGDLFAEANSAFVDEDYDEALSLYSEAIELDEEVAEYYVKRSFCHYKLKKFAGTKRETLYQPRQHSHTNV